jgi:hypothetical protein
LKSPTLIVIIPKNSLVETGYDLPSYKWDINFQKWNLIP